jgi:methyl-accepting chemotaxis protein
MFGIRRDYLICLVILAIGAGAAFGIHVNAQLGMQNAQQRFRAESHAASLAAQSVAQIQFTDIYQSLRTISRLPSVRKTDRYAKNINQDGLATVQELYNNLASNVDVSEVYIVPKSLDADQIDPVTLEPQTPILMFDDLISDDSAGGNVTKQFEAEIYEYHLLHQQMLWFQENTPTAPAAAAGIDVPMISGHRVITCDNTVFNVSGKNSDRTGMIFSVPFFDMSGKFAGTVSAIIRLKAIRAILPAQNFALVNPLYGALLISPHGGISPQDLALAAAVKADSGLIYSEVMPLAINDPQSAWSLWVGLPNSLFWARPNVRAVQSFAFGAYTALALLVMIALAGVLVVAANARLVGRAAGALDALAGGDENRTLDGAERNGAPGDLARAFNKFRDGLVEKRQLEQRVEAERAAVEVERQRFDAERAEALANQRQVVTTLASALISFANGDLTFRINEHFSADYKTLRMDFNHASSKMEGTIRRVSDSTRIVETGARDIRAATEDLAHRIEQQAAQLEQTAAAMDLLTGTVRETSQNANNAAGLVATAQADAASSTTVLNDALDAMRRIEASSGQIANVITVIDEIAFQTNLLALNAGVEAARAGDAGRGFAVVATEVRALAQRSADAAKEIKAMISASGQQVGAGVTLVNETGQALLRITGQIGQITGLVRDIASAAQQQATALNEVNIAVSQLDRATQENARMVDQAAQAGNALSVEASGFSNLISEFKLGDPELPILPGPPAKKTARPVLAAVQ